MRKINAADKPQKLQTSKQREADRSASCQLANAAFFSGVAAFADSQVEYQSRFVRV